MDRRKKVILLVTTFVTFENSDEVAAYLKGVSDYNDDFKKEIEKHEIVKIMAKYTAWT